MNWRSCADISQGNRVTVVASVFFVLIRPLFKERQKYSGVDNPYSFMYSKRQEMSAVASDKEIGGSFHRAFKDTIVGLVSLDNRRESPRLYYCNCFPQHSESQRQAFLGPAKLAVQDTGNFL